jgi:N-methylhydantoinase B
VEEIELKYPLLVESYHLVQDSGGAGKFRGGLGTEWHIRPHGVDHVYVNIGGERNKCPPWGLWGGKAGTPNHYILELGDGSPPEVVTKRPGVRLPEEGAIKMCGGGGGGWGDPLERDPEKVFTDLVRGYISPEKARSDYGVVIDSEEKKVDEEATRALRDQMGRERDRG